MKVVGYVRVSTEEQAAGGVSLAAQREKIAAYARLYDLELIEIVEDAGASGKTLDRPGLIQALDMLRRGQAAGLVVGKLDRLTRSVADMAKLVDRYFGERAGKSLLSVADQVDTRTAAGRLVLNVLVSVSQWEREAIAERTADALRYKRSAGEVYGPIPLGFAHDGAGRLVVVQEEAATVERARELRASGLSLRAVAAQLGAEGRQTKRGGRWLPTTVAKLVGRAPVKAAA
jgi:DNA invertase Pin-like site-specific DNA recombinase